MINENVVSLHLPYQGNDRLVRVYVPAHEEGASEQIYRQDPEGFFPHECAAVRIFCEKS